MSLDVIIRKAKLVDVEIIRDIYNEGIEDRIATLEMDKKDQQYMADWFNNHDCRYQVIVAVVEGRIVGWASLNRYNARRAYDGVADLSVYISRNFRGKGIGKKLVVEIEQIARENNFHKIVLSTFPNNTLGQNLYRKADYREVGIFKNQGIVDGAFVDVMVMEKLL